MTPQERQLVADLFDRLASLEGERRDPDAEKAPRTAPPPDPRADRWTASIRDPELREAVSTAARSWLQRTRAESGPDRPNC